MNDEDVRVAPSILSADFGALAQAIAAVAPVTDWLHVDVMDGHFVPNLTIGPPVVASLRRHSDAYFDCHLMMTNPGDYLEAFKKAGADSTTVHAEVGGTAELVEEMHRVGLHVGLALRPDTPFEAAAPYLSDLDLLLVMTVYPGFSGQKFIEAVLPKLKEARTAIDASGARTRLEVDGGIGPEEAARCADAGARVFVAGSAVFGAPDAAAAVTAIAMAARGAIKRSGAS